MKNLKNNIELDQTDIIKNMEIKCEKEEWKNINGKKKWFKNCPYCGREQLYSEKGTLRKAISENYLCRICCRKGIKKIPSINFKKPKSEGHKQKISKTLKSKNIKKSIEWRINMSNIKTGLWTKDNNPAYFLHVREQRRIRLIENLKKVNKNFVPIFNYNSCEFIDKLNKIFDWKLQHALNGGEIEICGYFLDGYDKEKNIAFEYDEPRHYYDKRYIKKDIERENVIKLKLNCIFIRWNDLTKTFITSDPSLIEKLEEVRRTIA